MKPLTDYRLEELRILAQLNDDLKRPSFMHRSNWRGLYETLVRQRLVSWRPHPTMCGGFRETMITQAGRDVLAARKAAIEAAADRAKEMGNG